MNASEVKEENNEKVIIQRNDGSQELPLETLNRVLWKYEQDKEDYFAEQSRYRLGRILTIIDSSIADETQRKAVKDLVHDAWYSDHAQNINAAPYTHMFDVQTALGIETRIDAAQIPQNEHYNPYKELVK